MVTGRRNTISTPAAKPCSLAAIAMKSIITFTFFSICLIQNLLGQQQPNFKPQDFPLHGDTILFISDSIPVPTLVGMRLGEAKRVLQKYNIDIGAIIYTGEKNLDSQIVYRQSHLSSNRSKKMNAKNKKQRLIDLWIVSPANNPNALKKPSRETRAIIRQKS